MSSQITGSNVRDFIQGNSKYLLRNGLPQWQQEQIELRKFLCKDCANSSNCHVCGCKVPNLFYAPLKVDANNKWGPFFSEVQWEILKNNIDQYAEFIKILPLASRESSDAIELNEAVNKISE